MVDVMGQAVVILKKGQGRTIKMAIQWAKGL